MAKQAVEPSEDQIQATFIKLLPLLSWKHGSIWQWGFHCPNGGSRNPREALKLKRMGVKPGVPDWILPLPRNGKQGFAIEFKSRRGVVTKEQRAYLTFLEFQGWQVHVLRDAREAIIALDLYLGGDGRTVTFPSR